MSLSRILKVFFVSGLSLMTFTGTARAIVVNETGPISHYVSQNLPIREDLQTFCAGNRPVPSWMSDLVDSIVLRKKYCDIANPGDDLTETAKKLEKLGMLVVTQAPSGLPDYGETGSYLAQLVTLSLVGYGGYNSIFTNSFFLLEGSLGGISPRNQTNLGASQQVERDAGIYTDLALLYTIFGADPWIFFGGIQAIAGRTDNASLINAAPFAPSPFGGHTTYHGLALILAMERYFHDYGFSLRTYIGAGVAAVNFQGIQNGITTVTGKHTVPLVKAGVAAFWPVGNGWDIGAGLDFTQINGFTVVTNTNVPLDLGKTVDISASLKFRYRFSLEDRYEAISDTTAF